MKKATKRAKALIKKKITAPRNIVHEQLLTATVDNIDIQLKITSDQVKLKRDNRIIYWAKTKSGWEHVASETIPEPLDEHGRTDVEANSTGDEA